MLKRQFLGDLRGLFAGYVALALLVAGITFQPTAAHAATIVYVQSAATSDNNSAPTLTVSFPAANTAGNLIVAAISFDSVGGTNWSCSDSNGNVYQIASSANDTRHNQLFGICYAANVAAGANTVTVSYSGVSHSYRKLSIHEYSGADTVAPLDKIATNIATGTTAPDAITSTGVTPTVDGELIFGAVMDDTGTTTISAGTGFSQKQFAGSDFATEDQIQTTAGLVAATFTFTTAHDYLAQMATFKPSGTPPPPPTFDFSMSNGGNKSVGQNSSVNNTITSTLVSGTTEAVIFTASGLPSGANASFAPASCSPTCATTMTITTGTSTPFGTSTITVTGTAGTVVRTTSFSLTVSSSPDSTSPTVSLTAPANNAVVNGTATTVSATASDDVGVSGVQFLLDGNNLNAEDTTSPYSIVWNTTTASSGAHILAARARDAAGNATLSANVNVTVDNQGPTGSIVINNGASAINARNVTLNLSASDSSTVTQMRISNTTSFPAAETYATTRTWTLSSGTGTKTVRVQFKDALGNWSPTFSDTIIYETTAPTISAVTANTITNNGATITWTTNEPATSQVEYGLTNLYGSLTPIDNTLLTSHSVALTGLAPSVNYKYRVRSKDAAGNQRIGSNNSFTTLAGPDTTPPSVPTGLAATPISTTQINLAWNASTDNVGVTGYDLFREGNLLVSQSTRTFSDTGLAPATTYSYTVLARDAAGNTSAQSAPVNGTTESPDITPPTVSLSSPLNNATVSSTVSVSANASDTVGVVGVQFKLDGVNLGAEDSSAPYSMSWDTTLTSNGNHTLTAVARDAAGNSGASSPIAVTVNNSAGQSGFQNEILVTDLDFPTTIEFLPDGSFVVGELTGKIKRVLPGQTQAEPTPFMTITNIGSAGGLQGLFDIALDPNFAANRYFYVFYTLGSPNYDRLSRFTMDPSGATASLSSELVLYQDTVTAGTDHHGGALVFGNDGKLYVSVGEHFVSSNSQNLSNPRGKVLRINPDGTVPTDNPFYDGAGSNYDAIWAYGFRNPFRMSVDVPTGRIFVADVGGNSYDTAREEVNILSRGVNYHWPNCEGVCGASGNPIYDYSHYVPGSTTQTRDASVTGGIVYRGSQFPSEYVGNYFFGDYTQNWIRRLTFDVNNNFTGMQFFEPADGSLDAPIGAVVHFAEAPDGSLYYTDIGWENESQITGGKIRRIKYNSGNLAPIATASGNPLTGLSPLMVNFSSAGSSDPENQPLNYLWDFGDSTTSTLANPQHTYNTNGQYTVRLTVSDGSLSTLSDPLFIKVGNAPQISIVAPNSGTLFRAGDVINFSGSATDVEDGVLPASAYSWQILFHHNTHIHPTIPYNGVTSGTYAIETSGHDYSGNTNYEIVLTVTDSDGLQTSQSAFIYPDKVNATFTTSPAALNVEIDGISHPTPFVYDTLINFNHTINAPNAIIGANTYTFASWSDSGSQQHTIVVPTVNQTYTATYTVTTNLGLVAAYNFNQGGGTTLTDVSGNNHPGTLINSPTWTSAGKYGFGINFDGINDYITIGDLDLTGPFTVSLWATADNIGGGCHGSAVMKKYDYGFEVCEQMYGQIGNGTGPGWAASTLYTIPQTGVWKYYALTYDGATARLYVDGVQVSSASGTHVTNNNNLMIGTWDTGSEFYDGMIDEVRLYSRALTQSEIQTDMNSPL